MEKRPSPAPLSSLSSSGNEAMDNLVSPCSPQRPMKYLAVTGGTLSGLGKGTTISSIGVVLKSLGCRVTAMKIDPYLNIDAGTMSPFEHGEVYVLEDGGEVDLDLGNYERFLDVTLTRNHNLTTGKIYQHVIDRERKGEYLGKSVQIVPHVTDAIQLWIEEAAAKPVDRRCKIADVCLIEVGGTVGDIESSMYLEALQQFACKVGQENFCLCHLGYVPVMGVVGEQKTKPVQHSVRELRQAGLKPDFIFCRADEPLLPSTRHKIALFCQCKAEHVISVHDASNIYHVPLVLHEQDVGKLISDRLSLRSIIDNPAVDHRHNIVMLSPKRGQRPPPTSDSASELGEATTALGFTLPPTAQVDRVTQGDDGPNVVMVPYNLTNWQKMSERVDNLHEVVTIGVVGKYTGLTDSYLSVIKSLKHASMEAGYKMEIQWIESTDLQTEMEASNAARYQKAWESIEQCEGIIAPGGFGNRGIEGIAAAAGWCRRNAKPFFGICLGLQMAVIDFCRDVLGLADANSEEFDPDTPNKVVVFMPEIDKTHMGGTMRLGSRPTIIANRDSKAFKIYDHRSVVHERHRHRYEVNPDIVQRCEEKGLRFSGKDEKGQRMEIIELDSHPFFFCTQFHPEFTSRPMYPSPPFLAFVLAAKNRLEERFQKCEGMLMCGAGLDWDIKR